MAIPPTIIRFYQGERLYLRSATTATQWTWMVPFFSDPGRHCGTWRDTYHKVGPKAFGVCDESSWNAFVVLVQSVWREERLNEEEDSVCVVRVMDT